jgi:hypothetical protein
MNLHFVVGGLLQMKGYRKYLIMACCSVLETSVAGSCTTGDRAQGHHFVRMLLQQEHKVTAGNIMSCARRMCVL